MKSFACKLLLINLPFVISLFFSCKPELKSNEFNIYVSEDNPGWHFIDLSYDTVGKTYHRINVKFAKGQIFQTAIISSIFSDYLPTFLNNNGDTVKSGLWFTGEYIYDSLQRKFLSFYMPTEIQRKTIKDYITDPSYDSLRHEMNSVVETYLRKQHKLK